MGVIEGILKKSKEFLHALGRSKSIVQRDQAQITRNAVEGVVRRITTYPGTTPSNFPPPPYYHRGVGRKLKGGQVRPPSQGYGGPNGNLNAWQFSSFNSGEEAIVRASTQVTYAPYLSSAERQSYFHQGRWVTIEEAMALLNLTPETIESNDDIQLMLNEMARSLRI